jgi:hypothetical protein
MTVTSAPLLSLCFGKSEEEVRKTILAAVARNPALFLDEHAGRAGRDQTVIFEGLSFKLQIARSRKPASAAKTIFISTQPDMIATSVAIEFGPNLAGGLHIPAIVKAYLEFASILASEIDAAAVRIHAANLICGVDYFLEAVTSYVAGGPFPALALIAFDPLESGKGFQTTGLAAFAGQELLFEADAMPNSEMMRRVVRLVHDIAANGPIAHAETLPDIDEGAYIDIVPPDADSLMVSAYLRFGAK